MRQVIGGNGQDTTAATLSYLTANRQFRFANLYLLGKLEDPAAFLLTDWETDLVWAPWGRFVRTSISRGLMTSQIGLEVQTLNVRWSPLLTSFQNSVVITNPYQKGQLGLFDGQPFRVWRVIMPSPGDANTYGAFPLFGGRVAQVVAKRGALEFTINSFLDVVNLMVPPNVIENTNILASFVGNQPVIVDAETIVAQFRVASPSNATNILATCTAPTPGKIYGSNKFQYGYLRFNTGTTLAGIYSAIAQNGDFNAGGGVHFNQFILYNAMPWVPTPGDTFYVSAKPPMDQSEGTIGVNNYPFPFVPQPENAL